MNLNETKVIVTGAASGMGRYFVERFADLGADVAAADVNADALTQVSAACEGKPGKVTAFVCDVSNEAQVEALVSDAYDALGGLNGLVNNAGIFRDGLLVKKDRATGAIRKMSLKNWQAVLDVDLTGPFLCTREFAAKLLDVDSRPGVIVNISSISRHGNVGQSNYSAAKAGLVADTVLWARELARHSIRVGAIAPGFIQTPILDGMRPEMLEKMVSQVPLRRTGTPEEIFAGIRFIFECEYFTGRCIDIDGGLSL